MDPEVKSRRQLLEEAWDKTEETEEEVVQESSSEQPAQEGQVDHETEQQPDKTGVEEKPPVIKEAGKKVDKAVQQELKASKKIETGKPEQKAQPVQLEPGDKAPVSWKPALREQWANIPKEVRDEIRRREQHIERTLNETGVMRKFATDFAQMVQPYSHLIRAQNSTPLQAVNNLMQTAAGLMQGNPQQKAEIVSQIMSNYGVDVQVLDQVLSKSYNPQTAQFQSQQNSAPPAWARPMFDFMERAQTQQQQFEAQQRQQADREIEEMSSQPFFDDLRDDIADLMEIAAKRGKVLSLKDAYAKAVELDPEVSKLVKKSAPIQKSQNPVSQAAATLARARKAAKTISGAPRGEGGKGDKPKTRREMLSESWDEQVSS
jgi:hypothetical protein